MCTNKKKAFVFDIDGTIYDNRFHQISAQALNKMRELQDMGHLVGIATGRSLFELEHLPRSFKKFPFDFKIVDGGARILDRDHSLVHEDPIDPGYLEKLMDFCDQNRLIYRASTDTGDWFSQKPDPSLRHLMHHFYLNCPKVGSDFKKAYNILVWNDWQDDKEDKNLFNGFSLSKYPDCYEFRSRNCHKARAMEFVKKRYGIDEFIAFGDGDNDLEMLEYADYSYVPQNGSSRARSLADCIIDPVDHDGVARQLEKLISGPEIKAES